MQRRAVLYLRVSTLDQTTANQERELHEVAERMGCTVTRVYRDHGISGAKSRDRRPQFDAMCKAATKREFDLVMAWSVDRLGRSLQDLCAFLGELHATGRDLYLHTQGLDTNMLRHSCGYKLANGGQDTRAIQHYLGHRSIASTVRYTALAPDRFKRRA